MRVTAFPLRFCARVCMPRLQKRRPRSSGRRTGPDRGGPFDVGQLGSTRWVKAAITAAGRRRSARPPRPACRPPGSSPVGPRRDCSAPGPRPRRQKLKPRPFGRDAHRNRPRHGFPAGRLRSAPTRDPSPRRRGQAAFRTEDTSRRLPCAVDLRRPYQRICPRHTQPATRSAWAIWASVRLSKRTPASANTAISAQPNSAQRRPGRPPRRSPRRDPNSAMATPRKDDSAGGGSRRVAVRPVFHQSRSSTVLRRWRRRCAWRRPPGRPAARASPAARP